MDVFGGDTSCGASLTTCQRSGELNQQFRFVTTTKTLPPPPPPKPQPVPPQPQQQNPPPPPVSYFPIPNFHHPYSDRNSIVDALRSIGVDSIPNFHHPYSDRNSIVDALRSIGVDSSLHYRAIIGQRNGIPGRAGQPDFNVRMLNLLKSGKLIRP